MNLRLISTTVLTLFVLTVSSSLSAIEFIADKVITNAKVFTADTSASKWADTLAIKDGKFVFVGSKEEAADWIKNSRSVENAEGKLILPGLIDGHTHPGLISLFSQVDSAPFTASERPFISGSKEVILEWLKNYAEDNPDLPIIISGSWSMEDFGSEGPDKSDLDEIVPDRPVVLFSDFGHATWLNSKALELLGVTKDSPLSSMPSHFVRKPNGEPTGLAKEFAATPLIGLRPKPSDDDLINTMQLYLDHMASVGVTTIFDAGNAGQGDHIYRILSKMDKERGLPVRIEGSYHITKDYQFDEAVTELKKLRSNYSSENLTINTIKVHFDGVHFFINTAAMLEPYSHNNKERGRIITSEKRLREFMIELHHESIDLHIHAVGDRATRLVLNSYEEAQGEIGGRLDSRLTLTHLVYVDADDLARFSELDVTANFTTHWFGWREDFMGKSIVGNRASNMMPINSLLNLGANVSFSSDEFSMLGKDNHSPFTNMQAGINRQGIEGGAEALFFGPESEKLTLEDIIMGYTANGAYQVNKDGSTGTISPGKNADFVIMQDDIFAMNAYKIHEAKVDKTYLKGEVTYERTLVQTIKQYLFGASIDLFIWWNTES